jgi:uncharacterized delta-60 repeat protein
MSLFSVNRPVHHPRTRHRLRPVVDALEDRFLLTAGQLDTTFGSGGVVLTSFPTLFKGARGTGGDAYAVQIQSDGKIVAAGAGRGDYALARYNTDGSLDSTFGKGGKVETEFGPNLVGNATALAIQSDGKIIAVGNTATPTDPSAIGVARYNTNGTLDTTFGPNQNGLVTTDILGNDRAFSVVVQPDGKILVAGSAYVTGSSTYSDVLVRYNSNGTLDTSFGQAGVLTAPTLPGASLGFSQVALETINVNGTPTTEIVVTGSTTPVGGVVERFNLNGSLDTSFGSGGSVFLGNLDPGFAGGWQTVQPDGKLLEAWRYQNAQGVKSPAIARLNIDGSLDTTFNPNGPTPGVVVVTSVTGGQFGSVVVQPDGKIVAAGGVGISGGNEAMLLTCLNADGSLDTNFGTNGVVSYAPGGNGLARGVALQSDGKIVAAGTGGGMGSNFAVARFLGDSTPAAARAPTTRLAPAGSPTTDLSLAPLVLDSPDLWDGLRFKKRPQSI